MQFYIAMCFWKRSYIQKYLKSHLQWNFAGRDIRFLKITSFGQKITGVISSIERINYITGGIEICR